MAAATFKLVDKEGNAHVSLSSISWAWWDADPSGGGAADDGGTTETTDTGGQMVLALPGSGLTTGQKGYLMLYKATGETAYCRPSVD